MSSLMLETFYVERFSEYAKSIREKMEPLFHLSWWFILVEEEEYAPSPAYAEYKRDFIEKYNFTVSFLFSFGVKIIDAFCWVLGIGNNRKTECESTVISRLEEDPVDMYCKKQKRKWEELYKEDIDICVVNRNICSLFYQKKEFLECIQNADTEIEKEWRRRILLEMTPRGNVIMYYDVYKQGFAYFSDQMITYPILNAIAMKYVVIYGCRDFFLDNQFTFKNSPLLEIYEKDANVHPPTENLKTANPKIDNTNKVFARLKNYNTISSKIKDGKSDTGIATNEPPTKMIWKNRFVCYGKIANYSILQRIPNRVSATAIKKEIPLAENIDKYDAEILSQGQIMKEFVNYRQFKEMNLLRK